ncbi:shikimate [Micractinium conductrix]|uniref:Shikimate n=1 Tax=Micractinium conductrix TaxID=554055 RepID=A0A2P6VS83_9CHLO|nr:shikimate [Micractinium conductrix]|eukprot:PSC76951.1 shikimate [Micractinium conductrix]
MATQRFPQAGQRLASGLLHVTTLALLLSSRGGHGGTPRHDAEPWAAGVARSARHLMSNDVEDTSAALGTAEGAYARRRLLISPTFLDISKAITPINSQIFAATNAETTEDEAEDNKFDQEETGCPPPAASRKLLQACTPMFDAVRTYRGDDDRRQTTLTLELETYLSQLAKYIFFDNSGKLVIKKLKAFQIETEELAVTDVATIGTTNTGAAVNSAGANSGAGAATPVARQVLKVRGDILVGDDVKVADPTTFYTKISPGKVSTAGPFIPAGSKTPTRIKASLGRKGTATTDPTQLFVQGNSVLGRDEDSYAVFNGAVSANQLVVQETAWFGAANKDLAETAMPTAVRVYGNVALGKDRIAGTFVSSTVLYPGKASMSWKSPTNTLAKAWVGKAADDSDAKDQLSVYGNSVLGTVNTNKAEKDLTTVVKVYGNAVLGKDIAPGTFVSRTVAWLGRAWDDQHVRDQFSVWGNSTLGAANKDKPESTIAKVYGNVALGKDIAPGAFVTRTVISPGKCSMSWNSPTNTLAKTSIGKAFDDAPDKNQLSVFGSAALVTSRPGGPYTFTPASSKVARK